LPGALIRALWESEFRTFVIASHAPQPLPLSSELRPAVVVQQSYLHLTSCGQGRYSRGLNLCGYNTQIKPSRSSLASGVHDVRVYSCLRIDSLGSKNLRLTFLFVALPGQTSEARNVEGSMVGIYSRLRHTDRASRKVRFSCLEWSTPNKKLKVRFFRAGTIDSQTAVTLS
jgi:hypothetical protein